MNTSALLLNETPLPSIIHPTHISNGDYYMIAETGDSASTNELLVTRGGLESCDPNYQVDRKRVNFYAIEYILSGSCKVTLNGKEHQLSSGSVFCYGPHIEHRIENTGDGPLIKHFIDFNGTQVADLLWEAFLKDNSPCKLNNVKWLSDTFQQILDCGKMGGKHAQSLCSMLLRYTIERIETDKIANPKALTPARGSFERSLSYIEKNFLQIKRMNEVAKACHLSLPHLCRLFKRFSKESPTQLLIRLKLERAVELLSQGDYLIKEIADHVGFDDPFYFSYRFKQHFGVSPSSFVSTGGNREKQATAASQAC